MLRAADLWFAYPHRRSGPAGPAWVLRGVSVDLAPGRVLAIVGPNGAGKSTLLRLLLGALRPAPGRGSVTLGGHPLMSVPVYRRAAAVAFVGQRSSLAGPMTAGAVVRLGRFAVGDDPGAVDAAVEQTGIGPLIDRPYDQLSVGQQQRVMLARAMAQLSLAAGQPAEGRTVLADEPISAMDPRFAVSSLGLLRAAAAQGAAVGVVLHDLTMARRFADDALLLACDGAVAAAGPAHRVLTPAVLEPVFGVGFALEGDSALLPRVPGVSG